MGIWNFITIEIKTIGSSLLAITSTIERLRSEKTNLHGKLEEEYIISNFSNNHPDLQYFLLLIYRRNDFQ